VTADAYDELYSGAFDTEGAVATLAELTGDGVLLDLGSGTGRLLVPLAEQGVRVEGIEASAAMTALLRARTAGHEITVYPGDFAAVATPSRYSVIVAAVSTLFMLPDQLTQLRCIANAAVHLLPGGLLIIEAFVPDPRRYDARGMRTETRHVGDDRLHVVISQHHPIEQRLDIEHVLVDGGRLRRYPVSLRYAWPAEIDLMANAAGLSPYARWGTWRREPFSATTTDHITIYQRPR
jgi:SAM-dependent methyltransferase